MRESIVVGFDGTDAAYFALDWVALRASRRADCRIEITTIDAADLFAYDVIDQALRDAERRVRVAAPSAAITSSTHSGELPDALLRVAAEADLLVIGATRLRPAGLPLTGWRPLRTAARSSIPVVIVPSDWSRGSGAVVVGVDGDGSSTAALRFAAAEAAASGDELTLVHAWSMPDPATTGAAALLASTATVRAEHEEILERARLAVAEVHPSLRMRAILSEGDATAALLETLADASLLVLGTHHRGILEATFVGSVGREALAGSRTPVCVVPG